MENIGLPSIEALNNGFHLAFIVGGIISTIAAIIAIAGLRTLRAEKNMARTS